MSFKYTPEVLKALRLTLPRIENLTIECLAGYYGEEEFPVIVVPFAENENFVCAYQYAGRLEDGEYPKAIILGVVDDILLTLGDQSKCFVNFLELGVAVIGNAKFLDYGVCVLSIHSSTEILYDSDGNLDIQSICNHVFEYSIEVDKIGSGSAYGYHILSMR